MNAKDAFRTSMNIADFMMESYLSDVMPDELLVRPAPDANHLAWQLGHLISAERRLVGGIIRAAMDRAEDKARGADEDSPIARRRRRHDKRLLVTRKAEVADVAGKLGDCARRLVEEANAAGEFIVPRGRSVPALRQLWTTRHPALDDIRLIRLAARMSEAASSKSSLTTR